MIVAVNDFNMGAMENKGLNIFNSKYVLARPETATDRDFQGIEGVIAHEYFHNWTGNRITCRDWFQLSLKEGLTVFRDQEFSSDMGSRGVKRIEDVRILRSHQFAEDASPMAHAVRPDSYIEINNFYTLTVYEKGSEVVRMQHTLLGPEQYRKATDIYFQRYDGQAVTTDDFVNCMEEASGRDLEQFRLWYSQAGTPVLSCSGDYSEEERSYTLTVEQHCPDTPGQSDKKPMHIPISVGLLAADGSDMPLALESKSGEKSADSMLLELRERREEFKFINVSERPIPSLLRGFSAPVKVEFPYSDEELLFLMAHDSDGFNRWDAAQRISQQILLTLVENPDTVVPHEYVQAFSHVLDDTDSDQALLAEILTLPTESYLGDQMEVVDVDAIHRARESLKLQLATELKHKLLKIYEDGSNHDSYDISSASIARRSLRNLSLDYLMQLQDGDMNNLCVDQYQAQNSMTDVIAALGLIAHSSIDERAELLSDFYARWEHDQLVLDKWFTVQAVSKRRDTISQVTELMRHPAFNIRNPNRVRSLIGAFCSANQANFHAIDGSGYALLGDTVKQLDSINPQIAARMLRLLSRWRRYDEARQQLMRQQLEQIANSESVSKDVYEVASKSLG